MILFVNGLCVRNVFRRIDRGVNQRRIQRSRASSRNSSMFRFPPTSGSFPTRCLAKPRRMNELYYPVCSPANANDWIMIIVSDNNERGPLHADTHHPIEKPGPKQAEVAADQQGRNGHRSVILSLRMNDALKVN
ncbi:uncharacterized protein LOC143352500 [Halictus rubicundus]|uniref:uncharacterized protein LOC143352500 n=1 Tax=Halictus rubicundus TaxID=77578 RepID=UPI004035056A